MSVKAIKAVGSVQKVKPMVYLKKCMLLDFIYTSSQNQRGNKMYLPRICIPEMLNVLKYRPVTWCTAACRTYLRALLKRSAPSLCSLYTYLCLIAFYQKVR